MKNIYRPILSTIFLVSVISPVLGSGGQEETINSAPAVTPKGLLVPIPELQRQGIKDLQEKIMQGVIGDITDLHKKDEQLYRLGLVNQENWQRYEQIAFNRVDIQNFAKQAIADEVKDKVSEKEVIQYFGLDTTLGRMKFRKTMDAGMPELLATGKLKGAFNSDYLNAKDKILRTDLNSKEFLISDKIIYKQELKILPREIERLAKLEKLDLSDNRLVWLPAELGNLTDLVSLDLNRNSLIAVPVELGNLTKLERLSLSDNMLVWLPAELGNLRNLLSLNLNRNQLTLVPEELGKLAKLEILFLRNNQLTSLPAELGNLTNLRLLLLTENQLASLPAELGKLAKLVNLSLTGNPQLTTLPDSLSPVNKPGLQIGGFNGIFVPPK